MEIQTNDGARTVNGSLPETTQLMDGIVPVLTDLEGQNWARQLFTFFYDPTPERHDFAVTIDLSQVVELLNVEVVMFNCLQWDIGTNRIRMSGGRSRDTRRDIILAEVMGLSLPQSCDSLVHVCLHPTISTLRVPYVVLDFGNIERNNSYVHIAEVILSTGDCPARLGIQEGGECAESMHAHQGCFCLGWSKNPLWNAIVKYKIVQSKFT